MTSSRPSMVLLILAARDLAVSAVESVDRSSTTMTSKCLSVSCSHRASSWAPRVFDALCAGIMTLASNMDHSHRCVLAAAR